MMRFCFSLLLPHFNHSPGHQVSPQSLSLYLFRTSIVDVEVWQPVLEMLSLRDEEGLKAVSGVACHLLPDFSPSREVKHSCSDFNCAYMC